MTPVVLHADHLTVIRAALNFWREENGTEAGELLRTYSGAADDELPSSEEIRWLMDHVDRMELCYATISPVNLFVSFDAAVVEAHDQNACLGSVLVLPVRLP